MIRFFVEASPDGGQDWGTQGDRYAIVCDGLGGHGNMVCKHPDGRVWADSKVASHCVADTLEKLIQDRLLQWDQEIRKDIHGTEKAIAQEMETAIRKAYDALPQEWSFSSENANVTAHLATTVAVWIAFPADNGETLSLAVWAGDSRCYAIDADSFRLYTEDDVSEQEKLDAMEETFASGSPAMNNRIGLDLEWTLHTQLAVISKPTLLFVCSDGVYGCKWVSKYKKTPIHMEQVIRRCSKAGNIEQLQTGLGSWVRDRMDDDSATFMSIFIDPENSGFEGLCSLLASRDAYVTEALKQFPKEPPEEMPYVQEGDEINKIKKKLKASPVFGEALIQDAEAYVAGDEPKGTYARMIQLLTPLREAHRARIEQEADEAIRRTEEKLKEKEQEFDRILDQISVAKSRIIMPPDLERHKEILNSYLDGTMPQSRMIELEGQINQVLRKARDQAFLVIKGNDRFKSEAVHFLKSNDAQIDQAFFRILYLIQSIAGENAEFRLTRIGVPETKIEYKQLSPEQRQAIRSLFCNESCPDAVQECLNEVCLSAAQIAALRKAGDPIAELRAEKKLLYEQRNSSARRRELSGEEKDQIRQTLESDTLREEEARFYLKEWKNSKARPETLGLLAEKESELQLGHDMDVLFEKIQQSQESVRKKEDFRRVSLEVWRNSFKKSFEAWKDPVCLPENLFAGGEAGDVTESSQEEPEKPAGVEIPSEEPAAPEARAEEPVEPEPVPEEPENREETPEEAAPFQAEPAEPDTQHEEPEEASPFESGAPQDESVDTEIQADSGAWGSEDRQVQDSDQEPDEAKKPNEE